MLANHSSWWDGLMVFYLNQTIINEDSYAMMSQKGMEDYPFFKKLGAFSVNPYSPKDLVVSLKFAERCLQENKTVWIFPQGKEEHLEKRPISFMSGPGYLYERNPDITITMVTFYYTFRHDQRPELFIRISDVEENVDDPSSRAERTELLRHLLERKVDEMKEDIIQEDLSKFSLVLKGFPTVSEWLDFWRRKK
ncbi:lysophospholipid acyltransferase family protein [Rossellomorea aquimaris]|uniref:lysophospholipid acyltransferase family protein n=1 Tax=Rossellomorea aquimaris TaxID=189382 RepID=UPI001CD472AD|nr:lysophospholipid acyltransferase family protein [Rossellomorea aquimaris]MCA1058473.1 lysophospholipid acyltransferase family protein [Rossellomorea aquimaris]